VFFQERGISLTALGMLEAASNLIMGAAEVTTGAVADRWGRKTSMIIGALAFATALVGLTATPMSPAFIVAYLAWGASYSFISGADMAFVYDSLKADGRAERYTRVAGYALAIEHATAAGAAAVGGWLATIDMRLCFYASAAAMLLSAAVAATFIEPPRSEPGSAALRYREILRNAVALVAGRPHVRHLVLLGATTFAFSFLLLWVLLQPYGRAVGIPLWALGLAAAILRIVSFGGSILADRLGRGVGTQTLVAGMVLALIGSQVILWGAPARGTLLAFAVIAFASSVMRPTLSALLNREIPSEQRATILSIQSLLWISLVGIGDLLLLPIAERAGVPAAIAVSAVLSVVCLVPLLRLWARSGAVEKATALAT